MSYELIISPQDTALNDDLKSEISIFPNPANDILHINTPFDFGFYAELTDISGRSVLSSSINKANVILDLKYLDPGIYNLKIHSKNSIDVIKKIIIF